MQVPNAQEPQLKDKTFLACRQIPVKHSSVGQLDTDPELAKSVSKFQHLDLLNSECFSVSVIAAARLKSYLITMRPERVPDDQTGSADTNCYDGSDHDSTEKVRL